MLLKESYHDYEIETVNNVPYISKYNQNTKYVAASQT
jgi:hypothetical protein